MTDSNHYDTLHVSPTATQDEIKQAYRRLVKLFHPDSNCETANHERIIRINAAYEILKDKRQRQSYDLHLYRRKLSTESSSSSVKTDTNSRQERTAQAQNQYRKHRQTAQNADQHLEQWLGQVYRPVNKLLHQILHSLDDEIDQLSADPFDDQLLQDFQEYLNSCRDFLTQAQQYFRSMPNPSTVAGVAADLYHCLNQVGDGIEQLEFFTLNYDDYYLHTGQELFRIAASLRHEAHTAIKNVFR